MREYILANVGSLNHPCGTVPMGPAHDPLVVTSQHANSFLAKRAAPARNQLVPMLHLNQPPRTGARVRHVLRYRFRNRVSIPRQGSVIWLEQINCSWLGARNLEHNAPGRQPARTRALGHWLALHTIMVQEGSPRRWRDLVFPGANQGTGAGTIGT
jgi:hypothetical protein